MLQHSSQQHPSQQHSSQPMSQLVDDLQSKKGLPIELIHIIMRYTYRPQPLTLTNDIKSYVCGMTQSLVIYHNRYMIIEPEESLNWLLNDIVRYANANQPTNLGVHPKMYDILGRSFSRQHKLCYTCSQYTSDYYKDNVTTGIRVLWGLFTIRERLDFIKEYGAV
jgi:hypothetical protein